MSVNDYSHATGYDTVYEHYQQIQCYNRLKNKTAIFLVADLVTWPNPLISVTHVNGKYSTAVYDKRDYFSFKIVNFPYLCSNIPSRPAYGVYIFQLVRIARICSDYSDFVSRHYKLTERLISQGFRYSDLGRAFRKFAKRHKQVLNKYNTSVCRHVEDGICLPAVNSFLSRHVTHR